MGNVPSSVTTIGQGTAAVIGGVAGLAALPVTAGAASVIVASAAVVGGGWQLVEGISEATSGKRSAALTADNGHNSG